MILGFVLSIAFTFGGRNRASERHPALRLGHRILEFPERMAPRRHGEAHGVEPAHRDLRQPNRMGHTVFVGALPKLLFRLGLGKHEHSRPAWNGVQWTTTTVAYLAS